MKKLAMAVSSLVFVLGASSAAQAQTSAVAHVTVGSSQVALSQADLTTLLKSLDPQVRQQLAADPKKLDEVVRSRLAVEAVLAEAHAKGWDKQANVQALIDASRREVILRSYLTSVSTPPADYPSDDVIQAAYQKNQAAFMMPRAMRIAQIYVAVPPGADAATVEKARQRAADLARQVHGKGADFGALAQANSDDKASAAHGGDMGFVADPLLLPEIRKVADGMKQGDIAGPIQTQAGFHVIKLEDQRAAGVAPLEAVKPRLKAELRQQRAQQDAQAYMAKLVTSGGGATIDEAALGKALAAAQ
ncbi:peptidylprolyl isomerase [Paraburkholderia sp. ZP32-5]|uniref:peptidylprolyl isomerase n=1 Tax=Paraburkholderia sp. ZP32-5 TaxID=2883245 RepID=UPI001F340DEC|nr:peptidylprolyl isomerase [Paraburkholderia sp. ZP32-5]